MKDQSAWLRLQAEGNQRGWGGRGRAAPSKRPLQQVWAGPTFLIAVQAKLVGEGMGQQGLLFLWPHSSRHLDSPASSVLACLTSWARAACRRALLVLYILLEV